MPTELPEDVKFLLCWPTAWSRSKVPGSIVDYCERCKQPVNLSPSSQAVMDQIMVLCIPCGNQEVKANPDGGELRLMPGQLAEIERTMRKLAERDDPPVKGL